MSKKGKLQKAADAKDTSLVIEILPNAPCLGVSSFLVMKEFIRHQFFLHKVVSKHMPSWKMRLFKAV